MSSVEQDCGQRHQQRHDEDQQDRQPEDAVGTAFALEADSVLEGIVFFNPILALGDVKLAEAPLTAAAATDAEVASSADCRFDTVVKLALAVLAGLDVPAE